MFFIMVLLLYLMSPKMPRVSQSAATSLLTSHRFKMETHLSFQVFEILFSSLTVLHPGSGVVLRRAEGFGCVVVSRCVEMLSCSVESHLSWAPQRSRADPARCCRSAWQSFRRSDRRRPSPPPSPPTSLYGHDSGLYECSSSIFTLKAFSAHRQSAGVHAHLRATSRPPWRCTAPLGSGARCR